MKSILPLFAIVAAGLITALEGATNGWVTKSASSLYFAMVVAFGLSALILIAAAPFLPFRPAWSEVRSLPWYAWAGGAYGLATITLAAWATPKLGAGPALVAALLAQTALGLALDHYGVLGLERSPVTWLKVTGLVVMLGGAGLVAVK
ncbi:DMT family transporter [Sphingomonas phyllosphaerae]|uniref:DMT family transporter n=1 Tax=Sphingomonas phyllosphaerae TaxID=257003 RepID=UPI002413A39A|nr:DMT family transporter [Sphingomonas phyllosphaerae]